MNNRVRGYAARLGLSAATSGSGSPRRTLLLNSSRLPNGDGRGNQTRDAAYSRHPLKSHLPNRPPKIVWGRFEQKQITGGAKRPPLGAGSAIVMTNMDVWRGNRPAPSGVRDWSRLVAVLGDRASSERRKARPAQRGRLHDSQEETADNAGQGIDIRIAEYASIRLRNYCDGIRQAPPGGFSAIAEYTHYAGVAGRYVSAALHPLTASPRRPGRRR